MSRRMRCPDPPRRTDPHVTARPRPHERDARNWPANRLSSRACPPHAVRCRERLGRADGKMRGCSRRGRGCRGKQVSRLISAELMLEAEVGDIYFDQQFGRRLGDPS
jgi:hypothetical protein